MKKILIVVFILIIILVLFKLRTTTPEDYLVKINNYTITPQEFNEEFLASAYAKSDTLESRREFLDILIRRKLMVQDAEAMGLDKDKQFLKTIERFWEQSLLKIVMDKKAKQISGSITIPDIAVETAYHKLESEGKADRPYQDMYSQIKWSMTQEQETRAMNKWLNSLYNNAKIEINPKYFPKKE